MNQDGPGPDPPRPVRPCGHSVSLVWIACCEDGETDCPCICHDAPPTKEFA